MCAQHQLAISGCIGEFWGVRIFTAPIPDLESRVVSTIEGVTPACEPRGSRRHGRVDLLFRPRSVRQIQTLGHLRAGVRAPHLNAPRFRLRFLGHDPDGVRPPLGPYRLELPERLLLRQHPASAPTPSPSGRGRGEGRTRRPRIPPSSPRKRGSSVSSTRFPRNASIVSARSTGGLPMYWYQYCLGQFSKEPRLEWEGIRIVRSPVAVALLSAM
jgi:hypothetical protein